MLENIDLSKYNLKNDIIFKYVFGYEEHSQILIQLLNSILDLDYENRIIEITYLNSINLKQYLNDKLTILDIKAKDNKERLFNIEMQLRKEDFFISRIIYYHDKLFISQFINKASYSELNKTITIAFVDFELFPDIKDYHNIFRYKNVKTGDELTDIKELHFIELRKLTHTSGKSNDLSKWIFTFNESNKLINLYKLPKQLQGEEAIQMALKAMKKALSDEQVRELIEFREKAINDENQRLYNAHSNGIQIGEQRGIQIGEQRGILLGKNQGDYEARRLIAKNLINKGNSIKDIIDITGLTQKQIEDLFVEN
ncbi:MAG TPA: Rpn family recombination-promoting nuclease/putative transposase [Candidatus Kapabacteria bacterium]|nr:Rpn family recombination-promoting nuclease/putative transposase [Candidatus Kapabacteria bacterium]HPO61553.1 Rpn family recombination-promoting nuclease/putative transposase [Candidatus Kapabacteria bacterium]